MTASRARNRAPASFAESPHSASPFVQTAAVAAAAEASWPSRRAASRSIHGWNEAASNESKSRSRLPRSPFGSMARTGIPCRRSSSSNAIARPVFPEPVIPTISPWVSRSAGSRSMRSPRAPLFGSNRFPRYRPWAMRGAPSRSFQREYRPLLAVLHGGRPPRTLRRGAADSAALAGKGLAGPGVAEVTVGRLDHEGDTLLPDIECPGAPRTGGAGGGEGGDACRDRHRSGGP